MLAGPFTYQRPTPLAEALASTRKARAETIDTIHDTIRDYTNRLDCSPVEREKIRQKLWLNVQTAVVSCFVGLESEPSNDVQD